MSCKVSVIVPVYNVENYLKEALESIVNQTLQDIEIICINDGSKDNSKNILDDFQKHDERISVISRVNRGYGSACNTGLKLAKGEYIAIMEPDDFISENMYQDLYNLACAYNADIVKSPFFEYRDGCEPQKINWDNQYFMPSEVFTLKQHPQFMYFHPSIWSCIFKTEFLHKNKISFKEAKGAGWVDNPFQVQTFNLAERIVYTNNAYYHYRLTNPTSSSNIVNITNPFDRSDEIHAFLSKKNIKDENILAHLYKRELGYVETVLGGISEDLFDYASEKISAMTKRMDESVMRNNKHVTDYEKYVYESCKNKNLMKIMMKKIKEKSDNVEVVK